MSAISNLQQTENALIGTLHALTGVLSKVGTSNLDDALAAVQQAKEAAEARLKDAQHKTLALVAELVGTATELTASFRLELAVNATVEVLATPKPVALPEPEPVVLPFAGLTKLPALRDPEPEVDLATDPVAAEQAPPAKTDAEPIDLARFSVVVEPTQKEQTEETVAIAANPPVAKDEPASVPTLEVVASKDTERSRSQGQWWAEVVELPGEMGQIVHYRTAWYLTKKDAVADAESWLALDRK